LWLYPPFSCLIDFGSFFDENGIIGPSHTPKAESDWPKDMFADSVSDVATRIKDNDHQILISSRLEAKQILSEECGLMKSGPVEYLYALGYILSGNDEFATQMTDRIDTISTEQTFDFIESRDNGIWIRLLEKDTTAFVDASRIKTTRGSDGRPHLEMGSFVKATYMGNDPHTADPIFSVTEERVFRSEHGDVVPPNNQPAEVQH
uniref:Amidophosphoribosyltransferase n=1 Tax=Taenia asiatica TaxID=60517 RepID=A0A0R3WDB6_TAEAS